MGNPHPKHKFTREQAIVAGRKGGQNRLGKVSLTSTMREMLEREIEYSDEDLNKIAGDSSNKRKVGTIINLRILALAAKGNLQACQEVLDRMEGTAKQMVEVKTSSGKYAELEDLSDEEALAELKARLKDKK